MWQLVFTPMHEWMWRGCKRKRIYSSQFTILNQSLSLRSKYQHKHIIMKHYFQLQNTLVMYKCLLPGILVCQLVNTHACVICVLRMSHACVRRRISRVKNMRYTMARFCVSHCRSSPDWIVLVVQSRALWTMSSYVRSYTYGIVVWSSQNYSITFLKLTYVVLQLCLHKNSVKWKWSSGARFWYVS